MTWGVTTWSPLTSVAPAPYTLPPPPPSSGIPSGRLFLGTAYYSCFHLLRKVRQDVEFGRSDCEFWGIWEDVGSGLSLGELQEPQREGAGRNWKAPAGWEELGTKVAANPPPRGPVANQPGGRDWASLLEGLQNRRSFPASLTFVERHWNPQRQVSTRSGSLHVKVYLPG